MYLEFVDGTQLECIRILGGPRVINGIERDCLSIEIDPEKFTLDEILIYFQDINNLVHLYTRESPDDTSPRQEIGEGYLYRVDIRTETRKVKHTPGIMAMDINEIIRIVNIAQLTFEEYQLWKSGEYTPPPFIINE